MDKLVELVEKLREAGWVVMPVEPTPQMAFAGINAVTFGQKYDKPGDAVFKRDLDACGQDKGAVRAMQSYRGMAKAAPSLPDNVLTILDALASQAVREQALEEAVRQRDEAQAALVEVTAVLVKHSAEFKADPEGTLALFRALKPIRQREDGHG